MSPEQMKTEDFRQARVDLGLNQASLAKELGLSERTIRRYETGEQGIPKVVDLALMQLFFEKDLRDRIRKLKPTPQP